MLSLLTRIHPRSCRVLVMMGTTVMRSCWSHTRQRQQLSSNKKRSHPGQFRLGSQNYTASLSTKSSSSTISTTWQRTAQKVKYNNDNTTTDNVDVTTSTNSNSNNQNYMKQIRDMHDPSLHIKTLEDELLGSIGQALGKQGEKVEMYIQNMQKHKHIHQQAILELKDDDHDKQQQQVIVKAAAAARDAYNDARLHAIQARWELLVHRQAVGFLVDNHNYIMKLYPIGPALSPPQPPVVLDNEKEKTAEKQEKKTFGDQLDWWQRIGRWK